MRRPVTLLLATTLALAACVADRPPAAGAPEAAAPGGGAGHGPAVLIGVLIGAGLVILMISNSGLSPSPDPPG
jgi:hypothetical protein